MATRKQMTTSYTSPMSTRRAAETRRFPAAHQGHRCADSGQVEPLKPAGRENDVVRKLSAGDGGHDRSDRIEEKEIERERGEEENGQKPHAAADLVQEVGRQSRGAAPGVWGRRVGAGAGSRAGSCRPILPTRGLSCGNLRSLPIVMPVGRLPVPLFVILVTKPVHTAPREFNCLIRH